MIDRRGVAIGRRSAVMGLEILILSLLAYGRVAAQGTWRETSAFQWYQRSSERGAVTPLHNDQWLCAPSTLEINGSCGVSGVTARAQAQATVGGALKVGSYLDMDDVTLTFNDLPEDADETGISVSSGASFWDAVTFGGDMPATLRFNYLVDGLLANAALGETEYLNTGVNIWLNAEQSDGTTHDGAIFESFLADWSSGSRSVNEPGYFDYVLTGDGPVSFSLGLSTWSIINDHVHQTITGRSAADFSHTALFGIQALDAAGNDITDAAQLSFGSGVSYEALPSTSTPEPASLLLLGTGLLGVSAARRRRRQGRRQAGI